MKKNRKSWFAICVVVCFIGIMGYGIRRYFLMTDNTIKIGVLSFMTGTYAQMGNDFVNGINLAIQDVNNSEVCKINNIRFSAIVEDGKAEAKTSISAMNRLMCNNLSAVIVAGDNQVPVVAPMIIKDKMPSIATIISNSKMIEYNKPEAWLFKNCTSIGNESEAIAKYACSKLHAKQIFIFRMQSEFGIESENAFKKECLNFGVNVLGTEIFEENKKDFISTVLKVLSYKPDAIFVSGYGPAYCVILNQLRECGYSGVVLTVNSIINPETQHSVKQYGEMYYASFVKPDSPEFYLFEEKYKQKYSKSASIYSAYGYDSMAILAEAFQKTGSKNRRVVRDYIEKIRNKKVLLGTISFKNNGDSIIALAINKMQENGHSVIVQKE